jgi:hypothetical protein
MNNIEDCTGNWTHNLPGCSPVIRHLVCRIQENLLILNFQTPATQLATRDTHLCYGSSPLVVTHKWGKWSVYWEHRLWHPSVRSHWIGQRVRWALLYWSKDDKLLKTDVHWDFLDACQSAKTTRFYNISSKNSYANVSPRLQTDWNNQIKQVYWSFIMQLFQAWTKTKCETHPPPPPKPFFFSVQFHSQGHS